MSLGADVEATDSFQRTALAYAARAKQSEICKLLLDHGLGP